VGGTSAINSHSVVHPNYEWHDRLAEELLPSTGRAEWSSQGMQDYYKRWQVESSDSGVNDDMTALDHVKTSYPRNMDALQSQWVQAFEELGHPTGTTGFAESSLGAVTVTDAVDSSNGERSHAATSFLEPALRRGNVTLKTGVLVDKIVFDGAPAAAGGLSATGVRNPIRVSQSCPTNGAQRRLPVNVS
jgi:choline dehydrogenase-like flavoprotein